MLGDMEFATVVRQRRMVRNFTGEPVEPAVVDRALAHALRAPSAGFSQGWAFLVLDDRADVERFWRATAAVGDGPERAPNRWLEGMRRAPVLVVALSCKAAYVERYAQPDKGRTTRIEDRLAAPYWHIDTGMAALLILLTAVDEGLGGCFFGVPPERIDALRGEFGVPADHHPVGVVALGHPAPDLVRGSVASRPRRPLADVVHRGHWGGRGRGS
jgi:nitroreductase